MRRTASLLAILALLAVSGSSTPAGEKENEKDKEDAPFAVRAGRVYTGLRGAPVIDDAVLLVKDGRFQAVGRDLEVPSGMRVVDLSGHVIIPGLIDAETTLASDGREHLRSIAPEVRALDGWDFFADRKALLKGGITTVYVSPGVAATPGSAVRLVSGRGGLVKTGGHARDPRRRVLRPASGLQVSLGEISKSQPSIYDPPVGATPDKPFEVLSTSLPQSRPGEYLALRRLFDGALRYSEGLQHYLSGRARRPSWDSRASALYPVLDGSDYLRVRASRARDIFRMIDLARRYRLRMVLESGADVERLLPQLLQDKIPVIFAGAFRRGSIPRGDLAQETTEGLFDERAFLRLARAGVQVVLNSPSDGEVRELLLQAATAVGMGMDPHEALRSITSTPAEVLGVDAEVGTIAAGKHADFVVLGGEPFGPEGRPQAVVIEGEVVYQEAPAVDEETTVVLCGRIHTGTGKEIPRGVIFVKDGKIDYVGPGALLGSLAGAARVIDARQRTVVPGLIDCGSSVGTHAESLLPPASVGSGGSGGRGAATFRLADSVDPEDPALRDLLQSGITTVLIAPESGGTVSGQISALKVAARDPEKAFLRRYAAMLFGGTSSTLLKKAKAYHDAWKKYEESQEPPEDKPATKITEKPDAPAAKKPEPPKRDENYEPFRPLFDGEVPAVVPASSRASVESALKVFRGQYGIKVILYGLGGLRTESDFSAAADTIRRLAEGVILDAPYQVAVPGKVINRPRELAERSVPFLFRSRAASGARFLPLQVAYAVREGLDARRALRAMTRDAAKSFRIDERVGAIEKGKDADLVFLSGEPFSLTSRVMEVMVEGRIVYEVEDAD